MIIAQIGPFPLNNECIKGGVEASIYGLSMELIKSNNLLIYDIPRPNINEDYIEKNGCLRIFRFYSKYSNNTTALLRLRTITNSIISETRIFVISTPRVYFPFLFMFVLYLRIPSIVTVHGLMHVEKRNHG